MLSVSSPSISDETIRILNERWAKSQLPILGVSYKLNDEGPAAEFLDNLDATKNNA